MTETLLISNILLWVVVLLLCAVVVALVRQIGVLHERIGPVGALALGQGPKVGEEVPRFDLTAIDGRHVTVGGSNEHGRSTLLFFLSPTCPVCKTLLPVLKSSRRTESGWLDVMLVSDGDLDEQKTFVRDYDLAELVYIVSADLGISLRIGRLPYVVLLDEHGVIRAQGLVNSREHLESVFEAKERGVASIQQYLEQQGDKVA
ncbi:MAG: methylamine dehydrogenase accessory protein MauD [Chromatiales bacterium]|nr:MAG: methylamine dehydrogenase accessory protein MauD [Chromatiales bacterium]